MNFFKTFSYLNKYLYRYKNKILVGTLFITLGNAIGIISPKVVERAIDYLADDIEASQLLIFAGLIILVSMGQGVFRFLMRQTIIVGSRLIENDFRNDLFAHLQKMSARFFQEMPTGDIMSRMTNDLNAVRSVLGPGIMYSINTIITFIFVIVMMLTISPWLTLVGLVPIPVMAYFVYQFGKKIHDRYKKIQAQFSRINTKAQENLSGIRIVKSYAQENSEIEDFNKLNMEYIKRNMDFVRIYAAFHPMMMFIVGIGVVLVLFVGGILIVDKQITLGAFVAFSLYMGMLVWPSIALGWVVGIFQQGAASMERINVILDTHPDIEDDADTRPKSEFAGKIEFKNLTFSYASDAKPVLKNVSFTIEAGRILAIVGRTGAGKTTILNALNRIYNPPRNTVFIDDEDIREIALESLHKNIGYVPQETFLFSETITENIIFGNTSADPEEIENASRIAQIHDSILDFPDQYDTLLGERGINLSGGQKQRVAIARAIIRNPKILLLDDSLSAVDTITEEKILNQLKLIMKNRTCIWISHRISAIRNADKIIVLDDGKIAEQGTHSELLEIGGIYAELYEKQQLEESLELVE
jgi:ATP-binding cassette, subfamily B, multidrug efflux pump